MVAVERSRFVVVASCCLAMRRPAPGLGETRAQKKGRNALELRRSVPHVSARALSAIIQYCQDHDPSEMSVGRQALRDARNAHLEATPYGPMLKVLELKGAAGHADQYCTVTNPMSFLYAAFKAGGGFTQLLLATLATNPSTHDRHWKLILYGDEVVPGNQLQPENTRKVWALYYSFVEFHGILAMKMHGFLWQLCKQSKSRKSAAVCHNCALKC